MSDKETGEKYSPYCPVCSGCGEEGCCSPLKCKQDPEGHYCQTYLNDLRFGYMMFTDLDKLLEEKKDKYPELLEEVNKIFEKNLDILLWDRPNKISENDGPISH